MVDLYNVFQFQKNYVFTTIFHFCVPGLCFLAELQWRGMTEKAFPPISLAFEQFSSDASVHSSSKSILTNVVKNHAAFKAAVG